VFLGDIAHLFVQTLLRCVALRLVLDSTGLEAYACACDCRQCRDVL